ncbi:MAG: hypothetical protein HC836_47170 [Richelia sp. RM2_1_2]|nr:hypothetical protein [Richelia sp. RM2_1_2]
MSKFIVIKKANKGASSGSPSVTIAFGTDTSILCTLMNAPSGYRLVLFIGTGELLPEEFSEESTILDPNTDFIVSVNFDYNTINGELGTKNWIKVELRTSSEVTVAISNIITTFAFPSVFP